MLSISIVVYQFDGKQLGQLLDSLVDAVDILEKNAEKNLLYIIDNNDQLDQLQSLITSKINNTFIVKIFSGHGNIGYGKGHNLAIKETPAKYHLILNPDVQIQRNCLKTGLEVLSLNEDIYAVFPDVENTSGMREYLIRDYPNIVDFLIRGFGLGKLRIFEKRMSKFDQRKTNQLVDVTSVKIISGCFMLCKMDVLRKTGGFDNRYFLYFEDYALSLEIGKYGKLAYVPSMKIIHHGGGAARKGIRHIYYFIRSAATFFNQYGWKII